jgi:PKD repeat protein
VTISLSNSQTGVNYQLYNSLGPDGAPLPGNTGSALIWSNKTAEAYHVIATNAITACTTPMNGTAVVTINVVASGTIGSDQTICEGDIPAAFTNISSGTGGGSISYQWQNSTDNITYNNIVGATSAIYSSPSLIADMWFRRVAISTFGSSVCSATSAAIKVTVNNFVPGLVSADQTICNGDIPAAFTSITPTGDGGVYTYQWKQSTDGLTFTNIIGGTFETYAPPALTQDTWYKRVVTSTLSGKDCIKETNTIKITVINFVPGSIFTDQTICEGAVPAAFTSAVPTGDGAFTYQWQNSTDGITWNNIIGATLQTYTSGALIADTYFKRLVTSTLNGKTCVKATNTVLVSVNNLVPGSISADQTICDGGTPAAFTSVAPTGDGTLTYQWQNSLDGVSFSNITGATTETFSPGVLNADTWYKRLVISTLNGISCTKATNIVKVTVINFLPGSILTSQTICEGTAPVAFTSVAPSGDGVFTYQWQNSPDGTTFTNIVGATLATYAPGVLVADTWYQRVVTSTLNAVSCIMGTNIIKVTVNNFVQGSIGTDQTICDGSAPASFSSVTPTGDGTFTYQWKSSIDNITFNDVVGAVGETYAAGILTQDTWYKRVVTSTVGGNSCLKETNIIKVTVVNFVPGSISADQTICEGGTPAVFTSVTPTGDGAFTYQWKNSTDGVVFSDIAGATSETYTPGALVADTWYKRVVTATVLGVPCVKETNVVRVTVINFTPGMISMDQTICDGTAPAAFTSVAPTGDGVFTYQWQNSPDGITFTNILGAVSTTYTAPVLAADTWYRRVVTSTLNAVSCTQNTNVVRVTVINFVQGSISANQTICEGGTPAAFTSVAPSGDGVFTFQWQNSIDGIVFSNITGAILNTYSEGPLVQDTWYRLSVISTLNGVQCPQMTNTVKVTVNNFIPGTVSASQTICEGSTPAAFTSVAASGDGVFTYQWQNSPDGTTFTDIAGATLATYAPGVLVADTWYKRVVTSTLLGVPCVNETNTVKITVNNFIPGSITGDQTICEGSVPSGFTSVTPTGDGSFSYQWQSSANGVLFTDILGAVSETYNSGPLVADTWYKRKVTSTVLGVPCMLITNTIKVTVNNLTAGSITGDQTVCESIVPAAFTSVAPTADGPITYQWRSSTDGLNFTDIASATSETYGAPALLQDTWYKRVVTSTLLGVPCAKETNIVKITVNNVTGGTIISDQTICNGSDPVTFISIAGGTGDGVVTYQWQVSTDGAIFSDIAGANAPNYDAAALIADRWYKRITKSLLNAVECTKESNIVKVTINQVTGGIIAAAQTICNGSVPVALTSTDDGTATGVATYQWQQSNDNITFNTIAGATTFGYAPGALLSDKYYKRIIISILNGIVCTAESNTVRITVNPLPVAILTGGATICPAGSTNLVVTMPAGLGPFDVDIENYPGLTVFGYVSGANILVSPAVTTTYKLLRVRDANGCEVIDPSGNLNGTATVVVSIAPSITSFTPSPAVCEFTPATFSVIAGGTSPTYQWYVNEGAGFIPVVDGGTYFGATTATLQIFSSVRSMNGYIYHVVVTGCATNVTSADAAFTVNTAPEFTLHPADASACLGSNFTFQADATGTSVAWLWEVNKGAGFVPVTPDANFSGETTKTLTITNALPGFNNWIFRAKATGICGVPVYSSFARLTVINAPIVGLQPTAKVICENGSTTFIGNGTGYVSLQWQVFSGGLWSDITDGANYSGTATNQLTVTNAPVTLNGNQYRLGLVGTCATIPTNAATLTVNPNPVVSFGALPVNACGNVPIVLNGNPTGGTTPYTQHRWTGDVGPLNNYLIQSPTFNSGIEATYNLNYAVVDSKGCTANGNMSVIVDSPTALFTKTPDNGCTPLTVSFTKDMTGIASFSWDFGDGSPVETAIANPVHTFTNANPSSIGYYNVKLTVFSPGGCSDTFTSIVTVYPAIDATFSSNTVIVCSGNSITYSSLPGASKYFWDFGDGVSGYFTNTTNHLYTNLTTSPVDETVTLTTTSFYNCTDVKKITITVMPVPLAQFTAFPVSQIYNTAGNPVIFTNTTNPGNWTWLWKFGDGATSAGQSPNHSYTALGAFDVVLTVSNATCSDSVKHTVTVTPIPPVAKFDFIPSGCSPLSIDINNTSLNTDTPGTTFLWDFGDGGASTSKNPTYTYFTPGAFTVELTVTGPGGTSNYSQVVNAYASPKANFQVAPTVVFVNDEQVRMFNLSQGADSYLWEFGDGDTSKVKEPYHKYMAEGTYDVTLWAYLHNVVNGENITCSDKYVLSPAVTVEPSGVLRFSTVFTPNPNGPVEMDHLPTGGLEIDQFFFPGIREKVITYKLQIFNRLGVLIFESEDINKPWNGYYHNKLCQQGVYVWYVEGKYANGEPFKKVGDVTLLH